MDGTLFTPYQVCYVVLHYHHPAFRYMAITFFQFVVAWFPFMISLFSACHQTDCGWTILSFPPIPNFASNSLGSIIPTILRFMDGLS
jgi:hypothetical protein